jgi:ArsR family transcriptional regulator
MLTSSSVDLIVGALVAPVNTTSIFLVPITRREYPRELSGGRREDGDGMTAAAQACGAAGEARSAAAGQACCPLPAGVSPLPGDAAGLGAEEAERLAAAAGALSDPNRLRMLAQMAAAQCCRGPAYGESTEPEGVCVCEIQSAHGLAQSKVSYHLKVLREAGLVRETRRGKWSFYAVDEAAAGVALAGLGELLGLSA